MKKITLMICAAAFLFAACNSKKDEDKKTGETSKETTNEAKTEDKAWVPVDSAMMEKVWKENMTVGEQHKLLAKTSGNWTGDVSMWMGEGAPPVKSTTTSTSKTIYNGLYVQATDAGDMMGMPFEGTSTMGYDNLKKEFFCSWIDNMGSGLLVTRGAWDEANKKITLTGISTCMNGQQGEIKQVYIMTDDDHHIMEMYSPDPATGKQYKNMEIKYTRKK
ncbi:MAG TPA: DUF1579 domain-containing protein [Chitinophagaceae bacterium]|jgi:hypothetical protein|nr:DUF1579 domain-containing protein [Chitinophagaceae bacterium]